MTPRSNFSLQYQENFSLGDYGETCQSITSLVAHDCRSLSRTRNIAIPPKWDASPSQVTPQHFAGTHLYSWVERGTVRVKCLTQEHNTVTRTGPRPLDPESSALTTRQPHLPPSIPRYNKFCVPLFYQVSSYVPLTLGKEPAFYQGETAATHAFVPCGHVCSEETVR